MGKNKSLTWNLMYVGAIICALICVVEVYNITTTGDTANEWIIWTCVIIGFCLFGFGFVYEGRNREDNPADVPKIEPGQKSA
jgi:hypothetical protein